MTSALHRAAAEVETYVDRLGWDAPPALFALVSTDRLAAEDPQAAAHLGLSGTDGVDGSGAGFVPIEQDSLPSGELDQVLAQIMWPDSVDGCAVSQHVVLLPPSAEVDLAHGRDGADAIAAAVAHPERREARLVAAVLRDGSSAVVLRLRATTAPPTPQDTASDDVLTGPDLAPNLVAALLATFD